MNDKINKFINSEEFKEWKEIIWELGFKKMDKELSKDREEELIRDFETKLLILSIKFESDFTEDRKIIIDSLGEVFLKSILDESMTF